MIDPTTLTAFDVETAGSQDLFALQPFRAVAGEAWLTSCAVAYWEAGEIVTEAIDTPTPAQLAAWLDAVLAAGHRVVCWNAPFDVAWLLALAKRHPEHGIREKVFAVRWLDGMLLYRHKHNAPRYRPEGRISMGLKAAVTLYYPEHAAYADGIDFADTGPEAMAARLIYNQQDSRFTLGIVTQLLAELPPEVVRSALIEATSIALVADSIVEGLRIDTEAAALVGERMDAQRKVAFVKLKMNHPSDIDEKVLGSPLKLRKLLFDTWGLTPVTLTDTGEDSTDKETLLTLGLDDPRAMLVHQYREATYLKAKFATGLLGSDALDPKTGLMIHSVGSVEYNGDGMTRPQARIFAAYTGRMSYSSKVGRGVAEQPSGCAIHQWKRGPEYRRIITAPEGYDLIELDFAGQEFRWMAVLSGDPTMLGLCEPGEDAHAFMAARVVGEQYETLRDLNAAGDKAAKAKRQLGKVANLSLQYRTSPKTLVSVAAIQHGVKITLEEARAIHATYLSTYRGVRPYWKKQIAFGRNLHYVETLAGRRVHLGHPDTWKWLDAQGVQQDYTWSHESTTINFPIQGVGADQKYLALLVAKNYLPTVGGRFYMELHDGVFFVVPKAKSMQAGLELRRMLSDLPYKRAWGVTLPTRFPVDLKIGPSWGELKEVA